MALSMFIIFLVVAVLLLGGVALTTLLFLKHKSAQPSSKASDMQEDGITHIPEAMHAVACPHCSEKINPQDRFCGACGKSLS